MQKEIGKISITNIRKKLPGLIGIGDDLIIDNTEHYTDKNINELLNYPLRVDGIIFSLRKIGEAKISINLKEYEIKKNDIVICAPNDLLQASLYPGVHQSQLFIVSSDFLNSIFINLNNLIPLFISLKDNPVFHLTDDEVKELDYFYNVIESTLKSNDTFKVEVVRHLMGAYLYKLGSILHRLNPESVSEKKKPVKREEVLFNQFISLVTEYHRKERRVDYYAEQLFLSPKHFSTVIKKVSGKTAGEWIDAYVILEAKALLKYSNMSIQEVAYYMNFPNPSFFGKYFKHHTGMSPTEYKIK